MAVFKRLMGRHEDGRTITALSGPDLRWRYDGGQEAYIHTTKDGVIYVVRRSRPEGTDSRGHRLYRYWQARVKLADDEIVNLGDEYMIAFEGKEVCQIYEGARKEPKRINSESKQLKDKRADRW